MNGKKNILCVFAVCVFTVMPEVCRPAPQRSHLQGKAASGYIGDLAERVKEQPWSVIELRRRSPHPRTQAVIDALILVKGNVFYVPTRHKDSDHRLVIDTEQGREAAVIREEDVPRYEAMIARDKLLPQVFFDRKGEEAFIAYCAFRPCPLRWSEDRNGRKMIFLKEHVLPYRRELFDLRRVIPKK